MVQERVWLRAARSQGYDKRPEIVQQIQQNANSIILRGFFNTAVVERAKPAPDDVRAYYDAHTADYTNPERMAWRHILTKSEKDAVKARAEAIKSGDFEKTAQKLSIDPISKVSGGWLGYLTPNGTPPDSFANVPHLIAAALKQAPKTHSDPIQTRFGWHIVYIDAHDSATVRPFEGVRPAVEQKIANDRSKALYESTLDSLKKAYAVSVLADSAYFAGQASGANVKNAEDLFRLAQDTQDVKSRLALYERVVKEYPAHDLAAQAQFMIGFVNSEEKRDYETAEAAFKKMIQLYPKSDLVDDAEWMLKNMRNPQAPDVQENEAEHTHEHKEGEGGKP
jgi:peptidyl-prolyl cis-trans isomerase C